jgi:drug/metabolite transporter (DMT)-like permease
LKNLILYSVVTFIWGSTWFAITFQLGGVDPLVSVCYRFITAAVLMLLFCRLGRLNLRYSLREHLHILLQGFSLFGVNYWLVYLAECHLTSGLVAVLFSALVFMNILNAAVFLGSPIRVRTIGGAIVGVIGIVFVFKEELLSFSLSSSNSIALIFALAAAYLSSLGNIISAHNQRSNLPVLQTTAFGMMYGAVLMLVITLFLGKPLHFEISVGYIASLLYLSVFGSIIAFSCYLTLVGRIGPGKAGYVALVTPIVALLLSTLFEAYQWNIETLVGVLLILYGNLTILQRAQIRRVRSKD